MRFLFGLGLVGLLLLAGGAHAAAPEGACGSQADVPEADRLANTVSWTTASEQDNFGYNVFRGLAEDGPFKKVNEHIIPGHGTTSLTNDYSYRDTSFDPCKAHWYYVQSIAMDGERERFTPIMEVAPKRSPSTMPGSSAAAGDDGQAD